MSAAPFPLQPLKRQTGYAYLALLFAVILIGAALGGAAQVWHTTMQRERERQLLWVGDQYRQAIRLYVQGAGGASGGGTAVNLPAGPQTSVSSQTSVSGSSSNADGSASGTAGSSTAAGAAGSSTAAGSAAAAVTGATGLPAGARGPLTGVRYPPTLDVLLADPRFQQIRRYLRKRYVDPITGKDDWVPVLAPNGGVMGVHSVSEALPLKQANFAPENNAFTGTQHYSDWQFVYVPPRTVSAPLGAPPPQGPNFGPAPGLSPAPISPPR
ncbi:MAG: type II secretion system protein [Pseudomonadota bacterium]|nr:type II secretion system protein [Pseudomonadota bacterium]